MRFASAFFLPVTLLISGCAMNDGPSSGALPNNVGTLTGKAYGGQQPVVGGQIYLYAAGTSGYGGVSTSLLTATAYPGSSVTVKDASGNYYVAADGGGNFTITGEYTCTPGAQIYLYDVGGNSGGGSNTAIGLMSVLGQCPATGSLAATVPFIIMNEVSTVIAAYTMAGFAVDATHVSDDESVVGNTTATLAKTGMANAFAAAANLGSVSGGTAYAKTASGGVVPQSTINTLANILASCVNATAPTTGGCPTLLADATNAGVVPTDTATAAINIAHYPGLNVSALYALQGSTPPFPTPVLTSAPNDFLLGVMYTPADLNGAQTVAIDASGNAWIPNFSGNSLTELSSLGVEVSPSATGYTGGGLSGPAGIALDQTGNAWVTNANGDTVSEFTSTGTAISTSAGYAAGGRFTPGAIAIDPAGSAWLTIAGSPGYVSHLSTTGTVLGTYSGQGYPGGLAIDPSGNIWYENQNGTVKLASPTYTASNATSNNEYPLGGVNLAIDGAADVWSNIGEISKTGALIGNYPSSASSDSYTIALDGAANVWVTLDDSTNSIEEFTKSFVQLSPTQNYCYNSPLLYSTARPGIAVDGSGNVWVTGQAQTWVTELIGAATPVVTPISLGVTYNKLATRP